MVIAFLPSLLLSLMLSIVLTIVLNLVLNIMLWPALLVGFAIFIAALALIRLLTPI